MKRLTVTLLLLLLLAALATSASAMEWQGNFISDYHFQFNEKQEFSSGSRLTLQPAARLGPARFTGELCLDLQGRPVVASPSGLSAYQQIFPWELEVREAYVEIYDFPLNRMDFRAGRQLIPWGAGDLVSPTDNINPQDLVDFKDFGRRLGSDALQFIWYPGSLTVTAVFIPVFTPARLPAGWMELFLPPELAGLSEEAIQVSLPATTLSDSAFGLKLAGRLGGFDLSLSYLDGRYDLPVLETVQGELVDPMNPASRKWKEASLIFPRRRVLGVEFSGEAGGVGVWAEAAVFFPDKVSTRTKLELPPPLPPYIDETVVLSDAYTKYLVGADYTFPDGSYFNLQFLHGFPHERAGKKIEGSSFFALEDYLLFALEKPLLNGRVTIVPLAGLFAVQDFKAISQNYAVVLAPEVRWSPVDGAEFTLGVNWMEAAGDSLFSSFRDQDELYLKIKYSF